MVSRPPADIDLLLSGESFADLDNVIRQRGLEEIVAKRFAHKRAFLIDGVMIELFLVRRDLHSYYTNFWDRARHCWPAYVFGSLGCMRVASAQALQTYRDHYPDLHPASTLQPAGGLRRAGRFERNADRSACP